MILLLGAVALISLRLSVLPVEMTVIVPQSRTPGTIVRPTISPIAQNNVSQGNPLSFSPGGQPSNELEIPPVVSKKQLNPPANLQPIPETESIPLDENQSTREIPLPKVFQGCWQGQVTHLDSLRALGEHPPNLWMTKTYRFCYRRIAQGPFVPTLTTAGVDSNSVPLGVVSSVKSTLRVLRTDGRSSATLRAFLEFSQPNLELGTLAGTAAVDELTRDDRCHARTSQGLRRMESAARGASSPGTRILFMHQTEGELGSLARNDILAPFKRGGR